MWSKTKPDVEFQYGERLANYMASQSHLPHFRVLPLDEFTVMIPEPHATLQGVIFPSGILKIVFRQILFYFFKMQFGLWRAAAFVSSPIHLRGTSVSNQHFSVPCSLLSYFMKCFLFCTTRSVNNSCVCLS